MSDPIRVLVVTNTYPTEQEPGATPCVKDQVFALNDLGYKLDLLYINRLNKINYLRAAWRLFLMNFEPRRYDLIHAHYGYCGVLARLQLRYPVVVTFHGTDLLGRGEGAVGKSVVHLVDGVIVMTEEMKHAANRPDAHVIPFGVDTGIFQPYARDEARRELGLPPGKRLILFPWNPDIRPEKRFDVVRAAVDRLQAEHEDVQLEIVYNRSRQTIAKYMNACDLIVLASDHEGSPMVVREAIACLLPVVSVDVGDVRELVDGIDACHICKREPRDMADKLWKVLATRERIWPEQVAGKVDALSAAEQVSVVYRQVLHR